MQAMVPPSFTAARVVFLSGFWLMAMLLGVQGGAQPTVSLAPGSGVYFHDLMEIPGGTNLPWRVLLSAPAANTVSVEFYTADYHAIAGNDYVATNGTLTFAPGVTQQVVNIHVLDDTSIEFYEAFRFELTNSVGAILGNSSMLFIIEDDEPKPYLSLGSDMEVWEPDSGMMTILVPVTLSAPTEYNIYFEERIHDGTAKRNEDYKSSGDLGVVYAGQTNGTLPIQILGDLIYEENRWFEVELPPESDFQLGRNFLKVTILDNDAVPGRADHFRIRPIASPQVAVCGFPLQIEALDAFETLVTNFNGTATLTASAGTNGANIPLLYNNVIPFNQGQATWTAFLSRTNANAVLKLQDSLGRKGYSNPFAALTNWPMQLALNLSATEGDGVVTNGGLVSFTYTNREDRLVTLRSLDTNQLLVPATVLVPAGQRMASFDISVVDDGLLDGTCTVYVLGDAPCSSTGAAAINIHDNEAATVTVSLPATGLEGGGTVPLRVSVWPPPDVTVNVRLSNSVPTSLAVPLAIWISAGATSATVYVTLVNNTKLEGTQPVTVTGFVQNWTPGMATILVQDNETNTLSLVMQWRGPYREGMGTITNFRLARLGGTVSSNVTVTLISSDESEIQVPATVTILAGMQETNFDATLPDDAEFDAMQTVQITASAPGFLDAKETFPISDNDPHHLTIDYINNQVTLDAPFSLFVRARDISNNVIVPGVPLTLQLAAAGDRGMVPITPGTIVTSLTSSVQTTLSTIATNVQITVTTTNGLSATSNPFDVTPSFVQKVPVAAVDAAYDYAGRRLYVVVPTNNTPYSGRLVAVDPAFGTVLDTFEVGFSPSRVVIGPGGQYAYVTGTNDGLIRRFQIPSGGADLNIPLEPGLTVGDFAVSPANPAVLAVARRNGCCAPSHAGVVVYENDVMRPGIFTVTNGPTVIEFGTSEARLYGYDSATGSAAFFRLNIDAGGVNLDSTATLWIGTNVDFAYGNGRVGSTSGRLYNPETGALLGAVEGGGLIAFAPDLARIVVLRPNPNLTAPFTVARETNMLTVSSQSVPTPTRPTALVRCGEVAMAYTLAGGGLYIVRPASLADTDGDFIDDTWERRYFGRLNDPASDAKSDPDGDGAPNYQEFRMGTSPVDAASVLRIEAIHWDGSVAEMTFPTVAGKRYRINYANTIWTPPGSSPWGVLAQDLIGSGALLTFRDTNAPAFPVRFYRVSAQQ